MSNQQKQSDKFFLRHGERVMISLGPLTASKHCPYSCAFCYVQDDFQSYPVCSEEQIIDFLQKEKDKYNIIYISGDTDSFAPPRTDRGLRLLLRISKEFDSDLLFTTRTVFNEEQITVIEEVVKNQKSKGKQIYACISITRYSNELAYIEPFPIPLPDERISTIKNLHNVGATTVLALRPFLPIVPITDYITILEKTKGFVDIALGEHFYFIRGGKICQRVFKDGISVQIENDITRNNKMSFDVNNSDWDIWYSAEYEQAVREKCDELGIVFSMHSNEAIKEFLKRK